MNKKTLLVKKYNFFPIILQIYYMYDNMYLLHLKFVYLQTVTWDIIIIINYLFVPRWPAHSNIFF
jgi:hypothetical protein